MATATRATRLWLLLLLLPLLLLLSSSNYQAVLPLLWLVVHWPVWHKILSRNDSLSLLFLSSSIRLTLLVTTQIQLGPWSTDCCKYTLWQRITSSHNTPVLFIIKQNILNHSNGHVSGLLGVWIPRCHGWLVRTDTRWRWWPVIKPGLELVTCSRTRGHCRSMW